MMKLWVCILSFALLTCSSEDAAVVDAAAIDAMIAADAMDAMVAADAMVVSDAQVTDASMLFDSGASLDAPDADLCMGMGECAPGEMRSGCDVNSAGSPTSCGVEICTESCMWGACELAPGAQCLAGGGATFQCCTPPGGGPGWQHCSATTCQWLPCTSHSC